MMLKMEFKISLASPVSRSRPGRRGIITTSVVASLVIIADGLRDQLEDSCEGNEEMEW